MLRQPPRSTRTDTLFPYTTLFRSVVARVAKKKGAIVIGMVSTPFNVERARIFKGDEGLNKLRKESDTVVVLDNNRLLKYVPNLRSEEHTSELQSLMRNSYAVFCLKKKKANIT